MGESDGFYRIKRLPPYVFAQVQTLKLEARQKGEDIIDFGMGNPDQPTPSHIVEKMIEAARKGKNHRYSASRGITKLRHAIAGWYKRNYDVDLDPETETIVTIGSKEGLAHLALALIGPGDVVLTPTPTYPIHMYSFIIAGGEVRGIELRPDSDFFRAPSFLQVDGGKDVGVEFYTLSKAYNMPGWRVGFCCGNREVVGALAKIKSYLDYGIFQPLQIAGVIE